MRQAKTGQREQGGDVRVAWRWVPGGLFAGAKVWERGRRECKTVWVRWGLFAEDTTVVGLSNEIDDGLILVKSARVEWEETNKGPKEDVLEILTDEGGEVYV